MKFKISKTPWKVERNFAWSKNVDVRSADDKQVAFAGSLNEADARLIAFAPKLLEALENIVAIAEAETWDKATTGRQILFKDARAAIAAAKGE